MRLSSIVWRPCSVADRQRDRQTGHTTMAYITRYSIDSRGKNWFSFAESVIENQRDVFETQYL